MASGVSDAGFEVDAALGAWVGSAGWVEVMSVEGSGVASDFLEKRGEESEKRPDAKEAEGEGAGWGVLRDA